MRPPGDDAIIASLAPPQKVGLTLFGEGRGTLVRGDAELRGIGSVILNRVKAHRVREFGLSADDACLKPAQFSCWAPLDGPVNYDAVLTAARHLLRGGAIGPILQQCLALAARVCDGTLPDSVGGSTHYITEALLVAAPPSWVHNGAGSTKRPTVIIGTTAFFSGIA